MNIQVLSLDQESVLASRALDIEYLTDGGGYAIHADDEVTVVLTSFYSPKLFVETVEVN